MGFGLGDIFDKGKDLIEDVGDMFTGGAYSQEDAYKEQSKEQAKELKRIAKDNAEISRYDAQVAIKTAESIRKKAERDFQLRFRHMERLLGAQKAAFASAGVRVGEGTPINVMSETATAAMRDASIEYYENRSAEERARSQAERFELLAEKGLREAGGAAYLTEQAGQNASNNALNQGYATGAKNIYTIGEVIGWW